MFLMSKQKSKFIKKTKQKNKTKNNKNLKSPKSPQVYVKYNKLYNFSHV